METKVYQFKGLKFRISQTAMPAVDGIPYFNSGEFGWIKSQGLGHDEFRFLCLARCDNPRSPVVPEQLVKEAVRCANTIGLEILAMLRQGGAKPRSENGN